jgi:HK97 family phage portal protein
LGLLSRILRPSAVKATEGQYRPGPYTLPVSGGWLPSGSAWNFWQLGQDVQQASGTSAMVEACVSAYAQTVAMCPGSHWLMNANGGRDRQTNSALNRILRTPNGYQTISDFLLNATRRLYQTGNAFALAIRNDRFEVKELHLMLGQCEAMVSNAGEVFYKLTGNELVERRIDGPIMVPARDVLHIRLHTPRHPLIGETPLQAASWDVQTSNLIAAQQAAFYSNQARPGFVLSTDQILTAQQVKDLRERWDEQSQGFAAGGTTITAGGLKPIPLYASAQDQQLAEVLKLSDQHIALAFRVPLQVLGIGGAPFASTESLYQAWLSSGLGFALNHIEEAFGQLFGLRGQPEEYVEFDTEALLRSALKDRMEAYARGVQGAIYSPNEARLREGLPSVDYGDDPRVQQQVVPLSYGAALQPPTPGATRPDVSANPAPPPPDSQPGRGANDNAAAIRRAFARVRNAAG